MLNASIGRFYDNNVVTIRMPTGSTGINAKGIIFGSANKDYRHNGSISVAHKDNAFTLIGAGLNGVSRQVHLVGDTRIFGLFDCASGLFAGDITCRETLRTYNISNELSNIVSSYVQTNLLDNKVQPLLDASSMVNGNRLYVFGGDSWVAQTSRNYTQLNSKGIMLGNQASGYTQSADL